MAAPCSAGRLINLWTYLVAGDAPESFTKLALGWDLFKSYDDEYHHQGPDGAVCNQTQQLVQNLGQATLTTNRTPEEAEQTADKIRMLAQKTADRQVVVYLRASPGKPFAGKEDVGA